MLDVINITDEQRHTNDHIPKNGFMIVKKDIAGNGKEQEIIIRVVEIPKQETERGKKTESVPHRNVESLFMQAKPYKNQSCNIQKQRESGYGCRQIIMQTHSNGKIKTGNECHDKNCKIVHIQFVAQIKRRFRRNTEIRNRMDEFPQRDLFGKER